MTEISSDGPSELFSAVAGNATAQFNLGSLYALGQGDRQDYAQAAIWFRKAADQGNAIAQFLLGLLYEQGQGVPKDYTQAAIWYRKAADQGDASAQNNLGYLYALGEGVPQDYAIAHALFSLAVQTVPYARLNRDDLEKRMTLAEVATAQALSAEMARPGNLIAALDAWLAQPKSGE